MRRAPVYTGGVTGDRMLALLADRSRPLAEIAEALGYASYNAFQAACRRLHGAGPRELRQGVAYVGGEPASRQTATTQYQLRCTPHEREEIARLAGVLAERDGVTRGAAIAKALAEAVASPPKQRTRRK